MKQHAHLLILTIMFLTSCSDDTEVMKQESSPPSLTEKAPTYRTKENAIIEVELSDKNRHKAQRKAKFYINKCRSASCMQSGWKRTPA